jgi:hypothetical protein
MALAALQINGVKIPGIIPRFSVSLAALAALCPVFVLLAV